MTRKTLFILAAIGMLLAFAVATLWYTTAQERAATQRVTANKTHLVRMHSPALGPQDAPVQVVEFLDPACETCREFSPFVKNLMKANPGKIRLIVRYAPLHPGSDQVVRMLEAAKLQGKFWEALEALFVAQSMWVANHQAQPERALAVLAQAGVDAARLQQDMAAPEIAERVALDVADGQALGVTKTPEFFVNGRPLPTFGYDPLRELIDEEIAAAPR